MPHPNNSMDWDKLKVFHAAAEYVGREPWELGAGGREY